MSSTRQQIHELNSTYAKGKPLVFESKTNSNGSSHRTLSDPRAGPSFKSSVHENFELLESVQA